MVEKTHQRLKLQKQLPLLLAAALFCTIFSFDAKAINLISDEESETLLHNISRPIFKTAGINFNPNDVYLVNDNSLNAFVGDGNRLFIHSGTILAADKVNELQGVIAHEAGHIQGGHILRLKLKMQSLQEVGLVSTIVAGTAILATGRPDVGMAVLLGSQSSALNNYSIYQTSEERSADQAANEILKENNVSPNGMLSFMKKLNQQNQLNGREEIPYFRTHPVTRERITFFESLVQGNKAPENSKYQEDFLRVQAKLFAFLNSPQATRQKYPASDKSVPARYARVIADFKQLKIPSAQKGIDGLISLEPNNPYFHELKGQIYLETGKIKQAVAEYQKALQLRPGSALLQVSLAQAMLENTPSAPDLQKILSLLNKSQLKRPSALGYLLLSRAYGAAGDDARASQNAAEFSFAAGEPQTAQRQIEQARLLAKGNKQLLTKLDDLSARVAEALKDKNI